MAMNIDNQIVLVKNGFVRSVDDVFVKIDQVAQSMDLQFEITDHDAPIASMEGSKGLRERKECENIEEALQFYRDMSAKIDAEFSDKHQALAKKPSVTAPVERYRSASELWTFELKRSKVFYAKLGDLVIRNKDGHWGYMMKTLLETLAAGDPRGYDLIGSVICSDKTGTRLLKREDKSSDSRYLSIKGGYYLNGSMEARLVCKNMVRVSEAFGYEEDDLKLRVVWPRK